MRAIHPEVRDAQVLPIDRVTPTGPQHSRLHLRIVQRNRGQPAGSLVLRIAWIAGLFGIEDARVDGDVLIGVEVRGGSEAVGEVVGEGIEKKKDDFAAEVAAMTKS